MKIFCTPEFKKEYEKLIKNKSYTFLGKEIITNYIGKEIHECLTGRRLNGHSPNPFIKKRLDGSGGSRLYVIFVVKNDAAYLSFIHPKSGSAGYENISDDKKAELIDNVYECIQSNDLFEISCCEKRENLIFNSQKKELKVV